MFNNIGRKIKNCAEVFTWIGILASLILGFSIWTEEGSSFSLIKGIITFVLGALLSWLSSFLSYGFGQLIENSDILVEKLAPEYSLYLKSKKARTSKRTKYDHRKSDWANEILFLSNEELTERIRSDDWEKEYKAICIEELKKRK